MIFSRGEQIDYQFVELVNYSSNPIKPMNCFRSVFILVLLILASNVFSQTTKDSTLVTIKSKSSGVLTGKIVSESSDTIKLATEHFGVIAIAKSEIVYDNLVSIETNDGNEFIGEIVKEDEATVTLKTKNLGEVSIFKKDIVSQLEVKAEQMKDDKFWFPNPQSTRYFWSPNGYGLKKGEGYYQNIWILWNQFAYGITENISVGAGVVPLFLFAGAPTPIFGTVKFSIPLENEKVNLGGGAIFGTVVGENEGGLGLVYGLSTFGSSNNNVTVGLGYGFAGGEWASSPVINLNGMFRVTSRGYFITENYFVSAGGDSVFVTMLGGRWIIKRAALDYGLVIPLGDIGTFVAIPWLGFTIPFGTS